MATAEAMSAFSTTVTSTAYPQSVFPNNFSYRNHLSFNRSIADVVKEDDRTIFPLSALIPMVLVVLAVVAVAIGGNLLVLTSYLLDAHLRTVSNLYLFNLAVCDLLLGAVSMPFYLVATAMQMNWPFGRFFCKVYLVTDYTVCAQSVILVILISLDQLLILRKGIRYVVTETKGKAYIKLAVGWLASFLLYSPAIIVWDLVVGRSVVSPNHCDTEFYDNEIYAFVAVAAEFFFPAVTLTVLNVWVYWEIRKRTKINAAGNFLISAEPTQTSLPSVSVWTVTALSMRISVALTNAMLQSKSSRSRETQRRVFARNRKKTLLSSTFDSSVDSYREDTVTTATQEMSSEWKTNNVKNTPPPSAESSRRWLPAYGTALESVNEAYELSSVAERDIDEETIRQDGASHASTCVEKSNEELLKEIRRESPPPPERPEKTSRMYLDGSGRRRSALFSAKTVEGLEASSRSTKENSRGNVSFSTVPEPESSTKDARRTQVLFSRTTPRKALLVRKIRKDVKAARALFLIVVVFLVLWAPYTITTAVSAFCDQSCTNLYAREFFTWLLWAKSAVNPFLYAAGNTRFKMNFYKILAGVCVCCKDRWTLLMKSTGKRPPH